MTNGTDIVVTGTKTGKGGITVPDVPKTRITVGADTISRQRPGQTVNEIINLVPGVSFQNNDATGAAGGTFTIRGFDSSRISQTLDGIPLNDTGNYAIYSNQQQDPETLDSISVNLGSTDVDSPTASAVGGTVNIRTRKPTQDFSAMMSGTYGTYLGQGDPLNRSIFRVYGSVDTGEIAHTGVRAFFTGSSISADNPFSNYSRLKKQQYNARIFKDLGDNGDFLSLAGQWNENRNNFLGSVPLRNDTDATVVTINNVPTTVARIVGPNSARIAPPLTGWQSVSTTSTIRASSVGGTTPNRRDRRRGLRHRVRPSLQPVEHRQRPLRVALHAHAEARPHARCQLSVRQGQWRRHGVAARRLRQSRQHDGPHVRPQQRARRNQHHGQHG